MIRVDKGESFPITVALWDEITGSNASGRTVYYDVRDDNDNPLTPALNGSLSESTTATGVYYTTLSIDNAGEYICYAYCDGFFSSSEEIIVNPENIYELAKQNRHYNISVEEVLRTNGTPTASQATRNVGMNKTDYIITKIKSDADSDWNTTTVSGIVYAWYKTLTDDLPYKMGGPS